MAGSPGGRRVAKVALELGGGRGDRDDVAGTDLLQEEGAVGDANPALLRDPVRAPIVERQRGDEHHDVEDNPRRAAWQAWEAPFAHVFTMLCRSDAQAVRFGSRASR